MRETVQITLKYNFVMYDVCPSRRFPRQSRRRRGRRGAKLEARSWVIVLNRQFEAMQIGDRLRDAEAEPVSWRLAAPLAAIEAVKNLCPLLQGDPDARVAHERKRPSFGHSGLNADSAAGGRELDRVVD